jgi:tetratricopeptide (TPR) repeat protein
MGVIKMLQGQYSEALALFKRDLAMMEKIGDIQGSSIALGNIASILFEQNRWQEGLEHYKRCAEMAQSIGDLRTLSICLENIAVTYCELGDFEQARSCLERQLAIQEKLGITNGLISCLGNLGYVHQETGNRDLAGKLYNKALGLDQQGLHGYFTCEIWLHLSELSCRLGTMDQALEQCRSALVMAVGHGREDVSFKARILEIEIVGREDIRKAHELLQALLPSANNDECMAEWCRQSYRVSQGHEYKKQAMQLYTLLYAQMPKIAYKKALESLNGLEQKLESISAYYSSS